jgi:hypothetical protein
MLNVADSLADLLVFLFLSVVDLAFVAAHLPRSNGDDDYPVGEVLLHKSSQLRLGRPSSLPHRRRSSSHSRSNAIRRGCRRSPPSSPPTPSRTARQRGPPSPPPQGDLPRTYALPRSSPKGYVTCSLTVTDVHSVFAVHRA